ncbi:MAG: TonB-dependent receptor [Salinivirgaceae bacterium]|jgi:TonB-linked SusC/RagA family outer membrane protein|nr:TonB-dependent receptor [Salinivirgaceae bacterium]
MGNIKCFFRRIDSRKILYKSKSLLLAIMLLFALSANVLSQQIQITGKVIDVKGEAIPGVNVIVKGTSDGTISDANGVYSIDNVAVDATLVFSMIGFTNSEIEVENRSIIDATLSLDFIDLNEVVVVGYGEMRKADLTGSVSSLTEADIVKTAAPSITSTLTGKMTGVITRQVSGAPGSDNPKILIRGKSTFDPDKKGTNDPLVLIDGIERDFDRIDPNDIQSITILKDAASAAVYGSRGANGVILVTTKRGKNAKPEITFSTSYTSQKPTFRPEYMNAGEYAQYINEGLINGEQPALFTDEQVAQYKNGTLPGTDWWSEMMKKSAPISQYNLSANGGNEKTTYFLSLGYLDQGGLYEMASYKRYNVRSNIDTKITDNFSVSFDISARNDKTSGSTVDDYVLYQTLESAVPTNLAYVPLEFRVPGDELGLNFNGTAGSPMGQAIYSGYKRSENNNLESKLGFKYKVPYLEGLSARVDFSYDTKFTDEKRFTKPYTLNYYTIENGLTSTIESASLIELKQFNEKRVRKTFQSGLDFNRAFGSHNFSSLLLFEQMDYRYDKLSGSREGFMSPEIDQLFAGSDINKNSDGTAEENARRGYVGRVMYNYSDKYLVQLNGRYDGSYNFKSGHKWGVFPAVSAGWRISEEYFMTNISIISNLKLRASWGQFGNDRIDPYQFLEGYTYSNGYLVGDTYMTGIKDTGIPNQIVTWETATNTNFGFDFGLLKGKISGEFDYFTKSTKDILITRNASVPTFVGATLPPENLGIVDNKGFEAILRYKETKGSFKYEIEGNITYATSIVNYIDEPLEVEDRVKETGRPFDSKYGYTAIGLFQSQEEIDNAPDQDGNENTSIRQGDIRYLDLDSNDTINSYDRQYIGKADNPELIFGLNASVSYKNFALSASFQGASIYGRYKYLSSFEKNYNTYKVLEDSWREGNEDAKYPRLEAPGRSPNNALYSSYWLNDGFYIKLRNVELSYTFKENPILKNIGIEQLRLSASGRNLLTIAKKDGFDPEGTDNRYPIMRTMSLGLSVVF